MDIDALTLSRKLIKKKIRTYRDEIMYNKSDVDFVESIRNKILKLRWIVNDLTLIINDML
jgi:hypothetical protein